MVTSTINFWPCFSHRSPQAWVKSHVKNQLQLLLNRKTLFTLGKSTKFLPLRNTRIKSRSIYRKAYILCFHPHFTNTNHPSCVSSFSPLKLISSTITSFTKHKHKHSTPVPLWNQPINTFFLLSSMYTRHHSTICSLTLAHFTINPLLISKTKYRTNVLFQ